MVVVSDVSRDLYSLACVLEAFAALSVVKVVLSVPVATIWEVNHGDDWVDDRYCSGYQVGVSDDNYEMLSKIHTGNWVGLVSNDVAGGIADNLMLPNTGSESGVPLDHYGRPFKFDSEFSAAQASGMRALDQN